MNSSPAPVSNPDQSPSFETATTAHAAALLASGLRLAGYRLDGKSVRFRFADSERAADVLAHYISGQLQVDAKRFVESFNQLRDLVRAARGGRG